MQRTRYQLGPGGVVYVVCTALIFAGALYTQANLLFWAFGLTMGGLVVSLLIACMGLRKLTVQRLLPSQGVVGRPLVLRYRIENHGWVPIFGLVVGEAWPRASRRWWSLRRQPGENDPTGQFPRRLKAAPLGWALHLGPQQAIQAEALCWPLLRGELRFEKVTLSSSFPFGVICKVIEVSHRDTVLVYPRLYRVSRRMLYRAAIAAPSGRRQTERPGGYEEFFGLRRYRSGDNLKSIDWKHSAKTGKLISRELTQSSPPRIMLALDLRTCQPPPPPVDGKDATTTSMDAADPAEQAISLAASLVCDSYLHGYRIGLVVWGPRCNAYSVQHSLPHRTRILESLSKLNLSQRSEPRLWSAQISVEPSIVVRPGPSVAAGARQNGRIVVGTDDFHALLSELDEDVQTLLNRRSVSTSRRSEIAASGPAVSTPVPRGRI